MNFLCKISIKKIFFLLKNKIISNYELTKCCLKNLINIKKKNNFNIDFFYKESLNFAKKMDNNREILLPVSLKNIFLTNKKILTCNSKLFKNKKCNFDSNLVKILKKNNFNILSFDKLEEFCVGGTGICDSYIKNLFNYKKIIGGSSCGSSLNIAYGCSLTAFASDTGGSVRTPASFCNIIGYKPTNGIFSRNGMVAYSSYLDNCSIISNNFEDCKFIFNILKNKNLDLLSNYKYVNFNFKKNNIFLLLNYKECYCSIEIKFLFDNIIKFLEELNFIVLNKNLNFNSYINLYDSLSSKDFFSNSCRYDGIKYGFSKNIYKNENDFIKLNRIFSINCKNKIIKGLNFLNLKNNINNLNIFDIKKFFNKCFLISNYLILPTNLKFFDKNNSRFSDYIDLLTVSANILGYPSVNLKMGFVNHTPIGFQILSNKQNDIELLNIAILYESYNFKKYVFN